LGKLVLGIMGIRDVALNVFDWMVSIPCEAWATSHTKNLLGATGGVWEWEYFG
jgi:hypothetical protein